jgi:type II secretory pathway component PulF
MLISNGGPDLDLVALGRHTVTDVNGVKAVSLGTSNANTAVATRLAQSLSDGSTLASVMERVNGSLQNAYRTVTNFVKKFYQT